MSVEQRIKAVSKVSNFRLGREQSFKCVSSERLYHQPHEKLNQNMCVGCLKSPLGREERSEIGRGCQVKGECECLTNGQGRKHI
jgi:hypothetical protein